MLWIWDFKDKYTHLIWFLLFIIKERTKEKTMKLFAQSKERILAISKFDALYEDTKMGYFH